MSRSDGPTSDDASGTDPVGERAADWVAASTLRIGLAIVGFVLLLLAIGQAVGLDLLGILVHALDTNVGQWLVVAFVGLVLIGVALRGFEGRAQ